MEKQLNNERIILKPLTTKDSITFYNLYFPEERQKGEQNSLTSNDKSHIEFTERIISMCNCIFTIRTNKNPEIIIGDCALHDLNQEENEIEIGGTLLPDYWGKGIMAEAFHLLIDFAKKEYAVHKLVAKTEATNSKALKFAEKLGFRKTESVESTVILKKLLK